MAISNSLIVVIQNEPRDGDIVYVEKDEEAFRNRVREVICEEWEDDQIELGQRYYDDCAMVTIIGQEMQFPYPINNVCDDCFWSMEQDAVHKAGSSMVINFVEKADCENCKEE